MNEAMERPAPREATASREPVASSRGERDLELVARRALQRSRQAEART